jgi:16S rRNA (cytidine1402-2'-O)-methyltransferase
MIKNKFKLYLIPASLGEGDPENFLPVRNFEIIKNLKIFIVEEIKTARRFLRSAGYEGNFDDIEFYINNEHTGDEDRMEIFQAFESRKDIGLLSEAGVPCIADPGSEIVQYAHEKGIQVIPLVGPSSILLALMASGFNGQNFVFHGYLPAKTNQRKQTIRSIEKDIYRKNQTQIFIEAPYRNRQLFESLIKICSSETKLCIATDITGENEFIKTKSIKKWKQKAPDIHKRPTVFLLYK